MKQRSIMFMVFMSIITLGLYLVYWLVSFQNDLKRQTDEGFGGFVTLFLSIVTFGIYLLYWYYAAGKRLAKQGASDNSILYLILALIGFAFVADLLMQHEANNLPKKRIT